MAGQGSSVCYRFEHLAQVLSNTSRRDRLGVCIDTCHIFAAGYDLRTPERYQETWRQFDEVVGINTIGAFHLNDSKKGARQPR